MAAQPSGRKLHCELHYDGFSAFRALLAARAECDTPLASTSRCRESARGSGGCPRYILYIAALYTHTHTPISPYRAPFPPYMRVCEREMISETSKNHSTPSRAIIESRGRRCGLRYEGGMRNDRLGTNAARARARKIRSSKA